MYPLAVNLPEVGPGLTPAMMRQAANDFIKSELSLTAERLAENLAKREFTKLQNRNMKQAVASRSIPVEAEEEDSNEEFDEGSLLGTDDDEDELDDEEELDEEGEEEGEDEEEEEEDDDDDDDETASESEEEEKVVSNQKVVLKGKKVN